MSYLNFWQHPKDQEKSRVYVNGKPTKIYFYQDNGFLKLATHNKTAEIFYLSRNKYYRHAIEALQEHGLPYNFRDKIMVKAVFSYAQASRHAQELIQAYKLRRVFNHLIVTTNKTIFELGNGLLIDAEGCQIPDAYHPFDRPPAVGEQIATDVELGFVDEEGRQLVSASRRQEL